MREGDAGTKSLYIPLIIPLSGNLHSGSFVLSDLNAQIRKRQRIHDVEMYKGYPGSLHTESSMLFNLNSRLRVDEETVM